MTTVLLCNQNVWVTSGFEGIELFCELLDGHTGNHVFEDDDNFGNRFRVQWWDVNEGYTVDNEDTYEGYEY